MIIDMKKAGLLTLMQTATLTIETRAPAWINTPCVLACAYQIQQKQGVTELCLTTTGVLNIACQRCLETVDHAYSHTQTLAVCRNDEESARLMSIYDCVQTIEDELSLLDIVTDDLYLFSPSIPHESSDCQLNMV
jgi:uncharacterized protein